MPTDEQPDFGIDTPVIVGIIALAGIAFLVAGFVTALGQGAVAGVGLWLAAALSLAGAGTMVRTSRTTKPMLWRQHLDALGLRGDELALDVGCGRGLVASELAERLERGQVVGVDVWRKRDQSGNSRANADINMARTGVSDRVDIQDADATDLPFGDDTFDLVATSLALHNIPLAAERGAAMKELIRVTKPGGRVVILDTGKTLEYQTWLIDAEWEDVRRSRPSWRCYPPPRFVTATKPPLRKGSRARK